MSAAAAHVILLLAVVHDPTDEIVTQAAIDALVAPFVETPKVIVRRVAATPEPGRLAALLRSTGEAQAAVAISCEENGCARAAVEVARRDEPSVVQALDFEAADALVERGRAVGLLASTFLPEGWSRGDAAPQLPPSRAPPDLPPTSRAPTALSIPPEAPREPRWVVHTSAAYFRPTATVRADFALAAAFRRCLPGGWEVGVLGRVERGGLEVQRGDFVGAGGGPSVVWLNSAWARFDYGARLDLLAVRRQLRHQETSAIETHDYWALGGDLELLGGYGLSPSVRLLGGLGIESLSSVFTNEEDGRAARGLSRYRFAAEVGVLVRF